MAEHIGALRPLEAEKRQRGQPAPPSPGGFSTSGENMDDKGYIWDWRKIKNWGWFKARDHAHLFLHLIREARWHDGEFHGVPLLRGQLVTGQDYLSCQTGVSRQSIRTILKHLKSTNEITIQSSTKGSIITIVNYELYQRKEDERNEQNNQPSNQQLTSNQPAINQQLTTSKKGIREEGKKKRESPSTDTLSEKKHKYLDFVLLTEEEHNRLVEEFGEQGTEDRIQELNDGIGSKGYKYKSHYHTILSWDRKHKRERPVEQEALESQPTPQSALDLMDETYGPEKEIHSARD